MDPWGKGLWCLTIVLAAVLLTKLWKHHLVPLYKLFCFFLAFDFVTSLIGLTVSFGTRHYLYYFFAVESTRMVLAALMTMEIYGRSLAATPALAAYGRSIVAYIFAAAAVLPIAIMSLAHPNASLMDKYLKIFYGVEHTIDWTRGIFLLLITMFLLWFPVKMRRNLVIYSAGFIVWSLSRAIQVLILTVWYPGERTSQFTYAYRRNVHSFGLFDRMVHRHASRRRRLDLGGGTPLESRRDESAHRTASRD